MSVDENELSALFADYAAFFAGVLSLRASA
jgi:hypothetical protein